MIDAHVHVWQIGRNGCTWPPPELAAIHHDHGLADVGRAIAGSGVEQVVLVQSQDNEEDTLWLLAEASASPFVAAVVGWLDHSRPGVGSRIAAARLLGPLVGVRVMAQDRGQEYLEAPELGRLLEELVAADLTLDLLVRQQHLATSAALAARFPALRTIIDHGAKPAIGANGLHEWREAMVEVAACPNIYCKLSGLITEAPLGQPVEALRPYVEALLDMFGPSRLVWGSDWPVIKLNGNYRDWLGFARTTIPAEHHAAVFGGNARTFYRLSA